MTACYRFLLWFRRAIVLLLVGSVHPKLSSAGFLPPLSRPFPPCFCSLSGSTPNDEQDPPPKAPETTTQTDNPPICREEDSRTSDSSAPGAPFVSTYPRFRVDLNRVPRASNLLEAQQQHSNPFSTFLSRSSNRRDDKQLRAQFSRQYPEAKVRVLPAAAANAWDDSFPTCHAMAALWESAWETQREESSKEASVVVVLADPKLAGVAQNFVDLIDWANSPESTLSDKFPVHAKYHEPTSDMQPAAVALFSHFQTRATILGEEEEDIVNERTRAWVQRLLVNMGICPFTKHSQMSGQGLKQEGVPVGRIAYHTSLWSLENKTLTLTTLSHLLCPLMTDTWEAMYDMLLAGPNGREGGVSSILLSAPAFDEGFGFWAGPVFALLEASVVAAQAEPWLGVVCFHPRYSVSDGTSWPGFGHMHSVPRLQTWVEESLTSSRTTSAMEPVNNHPLVDWDHVAAGGAWQRRTPHATINVLRADQLAAAEQVRSSNALYPRNIQVLMELGSEQLLRDLERERNMGS